MLPGLIETYPQPSAISCSLAGGSLPGAGVNVPGSGGVCPNPGNPRPPNIIITGTGPVACAGVTRIIWTSTLIKGSSELSTWPTSCLPTTGWEPTVASTVFVTVHVTFGTSLGTRPTTSRSKSSTISGRRCSHHIPGEVTFTPFLSTSTVGKLANGLALDSS